MAQKVKVTKVNAACQGHLEKSPKSHLILLSKHKKFDGHAIARFCCSEHRSNAKLPRIITGI